MSQCCPISMATKVLFDYCSTTRGLLESRIEMHVSVCHCVDHRWEELIVDHVAMLLILTAGSD